MKKTICVILILVFLCTGCGSEEKKSNVTLKEMTQYEHVVPEITTPVKGDDTPQTRDKDGFIVVSDVVYVKANTLILRREPRNDADSVRTVSYGTSMMRTGLGESGWDRVYYENETAYVLNDSITTLTIQENRTFDFSNAMLSIVDTSRQFYSYDSMCEDLAEFRERFGNHMKLNCIGTTKDARSIFEIVIGNPETARKHIFFVGGVCGTEYMTSLLCMKQAEYYLCFYETGNHNGFAYSELSNNAVIHVIPMLNPDGVMISQEYLACVRDENIVIDLKKWFERDKVQGGTSLSLENYLMFYYANANGVDLRRNFDHRWSELAEGIDVVTDQSSKGYPGAEAGSEPETKALLNKLKSVTPDLVVTYHTTGAKILYNYGQSEPMLSTAKRIAGDLASVMNYGVSGGGVGRDGYGSFEGYCSMEKGIPTLGVYLGNGSTPLSLNEFGAIWNACTKSWAVLQLSVIDY
ncbi:MAG: hypothetical protein IKX54_00975 [Lachnospiraceae bacterium]|nr:hypothetical protein [Lachnospiraceae bacterium]